MLPYTQGPSSAAAYDEMWRLLAVKYPNASGRIYASTFDNYTQHLLKPEIKAKLPVIESEIGDTWNCKLSVNDPAAVATPCLRCRRRVR